MRSLWEQIAQLDDPAPKDLDPESHDVHPNHGSDTDDDDDGRPDSATGDFDGREHYEDVAPSRLRKPVKPVLGKRYAGSQIRREDLLDTAEDGVGSQDGTLAEYFRAAEDPFAPVDEGSEDNPFENGSSGGSESEYTGRGSSDVEGRKKMRRVSFSVPEDEDEEIHSDEAFGEEDDHKFQRFKFLGSRSKERSLDESSEEEDVTEISGSDERMDTLQAGNGAGSSGSEIESEVDSQPKSAKGPPKGVNFFDSPSSEAGSDMSDFAPLSKEARKRPVANTDRAALKALLSSDTAAVASSLSAAVSADAKKGRAVKVQHQTFDRLLDARIRLQKGLTAANSILPGQDFSEHKDAVHAAEEAALKVWNTITSMRHSFAEIQAQGTDPNNDRKRKRSPPQATTSTPISSLWSTTESLNAATLAHHRAVLNKWSAKVRASNPTIIAAESRSRLLNNGKNSANHSSITDVIDAHLATESSKLIAQSTSTSNNPTTATSDGKNKDKENHSPPHSAPATPLSYDDTPFYQSLLRDLISSRRSTTTTTTAFPPADSPVTTTGTLHTPGTKNKRVDTKASKGRKVRYTVHERLQNFMAAEGGAGGVGGGDSGVVGRLWTDEARDEFFGSLMGSSNNQRRNGSSLLLISDEDDEKENEGDEEEKKK